MTEEQKELLLKDICCRLPYGVKASVYSYWNEEYVDDDIIGVDIEEDDFLCSTVPGVRCEINLVKPYLFPMSSMTDEQKKEFIQCAGYEAREEENGYHYETYYYDLVGHGDVMFPDCDGFDWLNKNHFDYRGLIPMGLAIDCTNLNIY